MNYFMRCMFYLCCYLVFVANFWAAELKLTAPSEGALIPLLNSAQKAYLSMPLAARVKYLADEKSKRELVREAGFYPLSVTLAWEASELASPNFSVFLSTNQDFIAAKIYQTTNNLLEVDNLFIGTKYYWKVSVSENEKKIVSALGMFQTENQAPRLLRIAGVSNTRDIGGWQTITGKRVRQGLVYRSTELNDSATPIYYTAAEMQNSEEYRERYEKIKNRDLELLETIKTLENHLEKSSGSKILPYPLNSEWTVFCPDAESFEQSACSLELNKLQSIPAEFMRAKPLQIVTDSTGCFSFKEAKLNAPAVFMQEFEVPEDGYVQLNCGAAWFWDFRINGVKVYDRLTGNQLVSVSARNHRLQMPVRQGKNLVTVLVRSDRLNWSWCCAPLDTLPQRSILRSMLYTAQTEHAKLFNIVKEHQAGETRLSPEMKTYMLEDLRIKTDLDLRTENNCYGMHGSPLGDTVTWFRRTCSSYASMQTDNGKKIFAEIFKLFLNPENFPMIIHCIGGRDRTGSVIFVINGLLGVDVNDLYLDWEVTGFWYGALAFNHENYFNHLVDGFMSLEGETLHKKIERYVLDLGFTLDEINTFRSFMLE